MDCINKDQILYQSLPSSIWRQVSFLLNPICDGKDWKALAAVFNFTMEEVNGLSIACDPTMELFKYYEVKYDKKVTLCYVIESLQYIGRKDVVDDIFEYINNNNFIENDNQGLQYPITHVGNFTLNDNYDVFISYAKDDISFAKLIKNRLEKENGFKVCIDYCDFLPGYNPFEQVCSVIIEKCKKVIVILSPNFNKSSYCQTHAKIASSSLLEGNKHKVIPILYEKCEIPLVLKYFSRLDCTDPHTSSYFWPCLIKAINVL
ncbi:myeloid differentiation primary response protein MyD88-A-like [Hydra vulgaris]|uniref:myeloid differentiation primary response protein MyD88-A-like n=1 Tax=Hydra vulgaris TaxID=6087 RepID=UPI000641318B